MPDERTPTRRTVLTGAGATAAALALTACSSSATSQATGADSGSPSGGDQPAAPVKPLAELADIPVGAAVARTSPDGKPIVVAQPKPGSVVAFSAICTHMGCTVAPAGSELHCPCHGSVYDASTGRVLSGPAPRPLPPIPVHVEGGAVFLGPR